MNQMREENSRDTNQKKALKIGGKKVISEQDQKRFKSRKEKGTSLVIQWVGLWASNAGRAGSILGWGITFPILHGKKKNNNNNNKMHRLPHNTEQDSMCYTQVLVIHFKYSSVVWGRMDTSIWLSPLLFTLITTLIGYSPKQSKKLEINKMYRAKRYHLQLKELHIK